MSNNVKKVSNKVKLRINLIPNRYPGVIIPSWDNFKLKLRDQAVILRYKNAHIEYRYQVLTTKNTKFTTPALVKSDLIKVKIKVNAVQ